MSQPQKLGGRHLALILTAAILLIALLLWLRPDKGVALRELPPLAVAVTEVARVDLAPGFVATGKLRPARQAGIHFQLAGRVDERRVEPGERVEPGAVLLSIEADDFRDGVVIAEAQLALEQAAVERDRELLRLAREGSALQRAEVKRLKRLGDASLASASLQGEAEQRLTSLLADQARLNQSVTTAEARLALRQSELNRARRNLERTRLSAPFAGLVNRVEAEVGDYVATNQRVVELISDDALDLYLEVPGEATAALEVGMTVAVEGGGVAGQGTLVALQRDPDTKTHTHALRVRLPASGRRPGQLVTAHLPLPPRHGVAVVPVTALLYEQGKSYLFRVAGDRLERVEVTTGIRDGRMREVTGIEVGSVVVGSGVAALADGQRVVAKRETS